MEAGAAHGGGVASHGGSGEGPLWGDGRPSGRQQEDGHQMVGGESNASEASEHVPRAEQERLPTSTLEVLQFPFNCLP